MIIQYIVKMRPPQFVIEMLIDVEDVFTKQTQEIDSNLLECLKVLLLEVFFRKQQVVEGLKC